MRRGPRDFVQLGAGVSALPLSAKRRARLRIESVWHRATRGRLDGRLSPEGLSRGCLSLEAADEHWAETAVTMIDRLVEDLREADPGLALQTVRVRFAGRVVLEHSVGDVTDDRPGGNAGEGTDG